MPRLPRATGDKHVSAFKAAGWQLNHIEGGHHILTKEHSEIHLSVPVVFRKPEARVWRVKKNVK
jgi:predicted RNA binding protein YcfA (HicA-like mRNA interferase family)